MMKLATKSQKKSNVSATNSFIFITLIPNTLLYYNIAYDEGGESLTNSKYLHASNET